MRFVLAFATASFSAMTITGAQAQAQPQSLSQPTTTPATTGASSASSGNKVICRSVYHEGTLIRTQRCYTQRQWEAMRQNSQQDLNDAQMRGLTSSPH